MRPRAHYFGNFYSMIIYTYSH